MLIWVVLVQEQWLDLGYLNLSNSLELHQFMASEKKYISKAAFGSEVSLYIYYIFRYIQCLTFFHFTPSSYISVLPCMFNIKGTSVSHYVYFYGALANKTLEYIWVHQCYHIKKCIHLL